MTDKDQSKRNCSFTAKRCPKRRGAKVMSLSAFVKWKSKPRPKSFQAAGALKVTKNFVQRKGEKWVLYSVVI